ncbi:MAG TPA: hypothetical protein VGS23_03455 [Thermoplasmata archaeon]|nr:hypothetical protein [Thermoplasmata archaeon]
MPGAPNSPPKTAAPAAPASDELERKVLRRLAPSRIALKLDLWKGAPARDLLEPFLRAESLYGSGDYRGADSALDQLSVRFAEPRWPTLPEPFRSLRVRIPAPMPPHYDPEFPLPPEEKEARRKRREAEGQLALAKASAAWAESHGAGEAGFGSWLRGAETALSASDLGEAFWGGVDAVWTTIRARVPAPGAPGAPSRPSPSPPPPSSAEAEAGPDGT